MEVYYGWDNIDGDVELALVAGKAEGLDSIRQRLDAGAYVIPSCEKTLELVPKRIEKAIKGFDKAQPFPEDWHSYQTELAFPDHGSARADLLCQTDMGPCIVDFKTKVTGQDYMIQNAMFDYETSWQLMHYVFAARAMKIPVSSYAICLVVIEPFKIHFDQWVVDENRFNQWLRDAHYWWGQMERMESHAEPAPMVGDHRDKFGLCGMYDICQVLQPGQWESAYYKHIRA